MQLDDDLPESFDKGAPVAFQREGARKMVDLLWLWKPDSVKVEEASREGKADADR